MLVRVDLCQSCASKLKKILETDGESKMCESMGRVLCATCKRQLPRRRARHAAEGSQLKNRVTDFGSDSLFLAGMCG